LVPPPALAAGLPAVYDAALQTHPVATRICTAAALAVAGDSLAQARVRTICPEAPPKYDSRRAVGFVGVEALYRGLLQQPIFMWIVDNLRGGCLHAVSGLNIELCAALERTAFSQFIISPGVYYSLYFSITSAVNGLSWQQALSRWRAQFPRVLGFNLLFWFPAQFTQFMFIPARYKVPFICLAGFVWNFILSMLAGSVVRFRSQRAVHVSLNAVASPVPSVREPHHPQTSTWRH